MIAAALLFAALLTATVSDIRRMEIPDTAHVLLLLSGACAALFHGGGWISRLAGLLVTGAAMLAVGIRCGGLGGGDIKMGACMAFALGIIPGCCALLIGLLLAAVFALLRNIRTKQHTALPLAPFLSIGCAAVFLCSAALR